MSAERASESADDVAATPFDDLTAASLVKSVGGRLQLQGTACEACGITMLGRRYACSACTSTSVRPTPLPSSGSVYTWTVVHVFPGADAPVPVAYVDLAGGVRVFTRLAGASAASIGARVKLAGDEDAWWFEHDPEAGG